MAGNAVRGSVLKENVLPDPAGPYRRILRWDSSALSETGLKALGRGILLFVPFGFVFSYQVENEGSLTASKFDTAIQFASQAGTEYETFYHTQK